MSVKNEEENIGDTVVDRETLLGQELVTPEEIASGIVKMFYDGSQYPSRFAAYRHVLSVIRNERERCAKLADEFARRLRTVGPHSVAAGVEVLASEIRSGKQSN